MEDENKKVEKITDSSSVETTENRTTTEETVKKNHNLLKNKYFWFGLAIAGFSGGYIVHDIIQKSHEVSVKEADKESLLKDVVNYASNMQSISINTEIDMYIKKTEGTVTTPYMLGQAVNFDIKDGEPYMIYSDGNIVHQFNGPRVARIYERYEEITGEDVTAYDNREDLTWVLKKYDKEKNIVDSLEVFNLIQEKQEDFDITGIFKVRGQTCYVLEGELQYADLLPYLKDMVCFNNGDKILESITRNGFYGFVTLYINAQTGEPERLFIDFSETARAFAEVDGGNEGWEASVGNFHFKLDYTNYNSVDEIDIDLSVKENAIDEMIFWERLKNGDLTYEELIYYMLILGYTKEDFDFYMNKMGITGAEYDKLLALFNFDAHGNPVFPILTPEQYNYLKELFGQGFDYEYYQKLLGISQSEYEYYLQFFAQIKDYGNYLFGVTLTKEQYTYYYNLIKLSDNNKAMYNKIVQFLQNNYKNIPNTLNQTDFEYYLKLFQSGKYDYKYFKQQFGWSQEDYNYYKAMYELILTYQANVKNGNAEYTNAYEYYKALINNMTNYHLYINDFKYDQLEFQYFLSTFSYSTNYDEYKDYIFPTRYDSPEYNSNNTFINGSLLTEAQYTYYNNLIKLTNNNKIAFNSVMNFIKNNYTKKHSTLTKQDFEYYLKLFQSGKYDYKYFKQQFGWSQEEYNYYKAIYELTISYRNSIGNGSATYTNDYEYYKALINSMDEYHLYINDFKYDQLEFEYYLSTFKYSANYNEYKDYVLSDSYKGSQYTYYKNIYNIINNHNNQFTSFEDFYKYVSNISYDTFVKEFHLNTYIASYDEKVGEDAEINSGVTDNGELSNKWYSYSFKYKDSVIGLPVLYKDFSSATGFNLSDGDLSTTISMNRTTSKDLYKNGSNNAISVILANKTGGNASIKDCKVISITISQSLSKDVLNDITLPSGIKIGDKKEKIDSLYGEPFNIQTNNGLVNYIYRSSGRNETMKLTFSNNKLTKVTFTYSD